MPLTPQVIVAANLQQITGSVDAAKAVFELVGFGSTVPRVSGTTVIVQTSTTATADVSGNISVTIWGLDVITPSGCFYTVTFFNDAGAVVASLPYNAFVGSGTFDLSQVVPMGQVVVAPQQPNSVFPQIFSPIAHNFLTGINISGVFSSARPSAADLSDGVTGSGSVVLSASPAITGTLSCSSIRQVSPNSFSISDPLGPSHFFISNISPYMNTFVQGNGGGVVFLGSTTKTSVADTTGNIVTAGSITLQTTTQTLPGVIANDTAGGILFTNNAGKTVQLGNGGTLFLGSAGNRGQGLGLFGATSGDAVMSLTATGGTSSVITIPNTTDTLVCRATTDTLTNKRITPRVLLTTNSASAPLTLTADSDGLDINEWNLTGTGGTLNIALPTGTPTDGQKLMLRIKTTNSWTYSFGSFRFSTTITAPTATIAGKTDYIGMIWNALDSKWDVIAVDQGH